MKKTLYKNSQLELGESGETATLRYSLLESVLKTETCGLVCYGVEVKKTTPSGARELSEVKQIKCAFLNKTEALSFLDMLAENTVTPISLSGVLEDYITDALHLKKRLPILI